jgi:hypothetical protein
MMQTKESGKHDILPVAGASLDHAGMPVTLPRESDAVMCRDDSMTAQTVDTKPSLSPEECTAHPFLTSVRVAPAFKRLFKEVWSRRARYSKLNQGRRR